MHYIWIRHWENSRKNRHAVQNIFPPERWNVKRSYWVTCLARIKGNPWTTPTIPPPQLHHPLHPIISVPANQHRRMQGILQRYRPLHCLALPEWANRGREVMPITQYKKIQDNLSFMYLKRQAESRFRVNKTALSCDMTKPEAQSMS